MVAKCSHSCLLLKRHTSLPKRLNFIIPPTADKGSNFVEFLPILIIIWYQPKHVPFKREQSNWTVSLCSCVPHADSWAPLKVPDSLQSRNLAATQLLGPRAGIWPLALKSSHRGLVVQEGLGTGAVTCPGARSSERAGLGQSGKPNGHSRWYNVASLLLV